MLMTLDHSYYSLKFKNFMLKMRVILKIAEILSGTVVVLKCYAEEGFLMMLISKHHFQIFDSFPVLLLNFKQLIKSVFLLNL